MAEDLITRCAACALLEASDPARRERRFVQPFPGVWVHRRECLAAWKVADETQRTEWAVRAVRWREAS